MYISDPDFSCGRTEEPTKGSTRGPRELKKRLSSNKSLRKKVIYEAKILDCIEREKKQILHRMKKKVLLKGGLEAERCVEFNFTI